MEDQVAKNIIVAIVQKKILICANAGEEHIHSSTFNSDIIKSQGSNITGMKTIGSFKTPCICQNLYFNCH